MQMRAWNFLTVGGPMRPAIQVKPHEDDRRPSPVLVSRLSEPALRARNVERKILFLVDRRPFECEALAGGRERPVLLLNENFLHRNQLFGLVLGYVEISHAHPKGVRRCCVPDCTSPAPFV